MFAEVAVPVYVRQTFTYRLPGDMASRAQPGCRVLVPLAKKFLTAFIVDLQESLQSDVDEADIKDVEELLDESPLITQEILELTRWVSDYYFAPWGECLRAALPAGATSISERVLTLTSAGRAALVEGGLAPSKRQALELLSGKRELTAAQLERQLSKPRAGALIRQLKLDALISVSQRISEARMKPKLHKVVRLTAQGMGDGGWGLDTAGDQRPKSGKRSRRRAPTPNPQPPTPASKPLNEKQVRVVAALRAAGDAVAFSDLMDVAEVSPSVVRTLEKRGIVDVFAQEVRRDPLAHIKPDDSSAVILTGEQQRALDRILAALNKREYSTFLLHGVTASGKTEVYIRAMREAVKQRSTALMLVPEISLTPIFSRRLRAQFGEAVAILHSSLSEGERKDEWRRIKDGYARVVIGT